MASNLISSTRRRKKKKKKIQNQSTLSSTPPPMIQWKSQSQQNIYSTKLLHALRQVQLSGGTPSRVRQAADRVLAFTAKGRSRWSRAILTAAGGSSRLKLKFMKRNSLAKQQRRVMMNMAKTGNKSRVVRLKDKDIPAVQRKAKVLGGLVPGCRKQPLNVVLEEASDYIAALEMQVRAMSTIADLLSASGSSSTTAHHSNLREFNSSGDLP